MSTIKLASDNCEASIIAKLSPNMDRWSGKVAIVTGASGGIGAAICRHLVASGMIVVGLARRKDRVQEGGNLHAYATDMTKEEDVLAAFEFAKTFGPIHVLVNCAGLTNSHTLTSGLTKKWREILEVNVLGLSVATREAVKDMRKNGVDGHIVHLNSVVGHTVPKINALMYCPSKFAVTALAASLVRELADLKSKIKVTSISPGMVDTDFFREANGAPKLPKYANILAKLPCLKPQDVVDAVAYVLSTPPHVQVYELTIEPVGEVV